MPDDGFRYDLVKGELRKMSPAGSKHGVIIVNLTVPLAQHVKERRLGLVFGAETGFRLGSNPDTVLAPDIGFVRQERVPLEGCPKTFWPGPPDLAVEVVSPSDTVSEVEEKVQEYLQGGTRMVWVVNPKLQTVTVYCSLRDIRILTAKDTLDGLDIVPGFSLSVATIFE